MSRLYTSRRDVLKAAGFGAFSLAGFSTISSPAAAHESVEASATDLLGPIQIPANSDAGFNYPYYLYVPESSQDEPVPMMVEPNNTGTATDDYEEHRTIARQLSRGTIGWTRTYCEALTVPLLIPVFPRPRSEPVNGDHYVHALDETTMNLDSGELNRVDLQLVKMVEHAQELLRNMSYSVADDIILNGFSASGNFVNRFTALHPDIVRSVTAGGINGTLILPLERAKGHTLNYHIGIADIEEITGERFDADGWSDVPQFIYLGGDDENDTIPYDDAWSDRQRQIALDVYGEHMQNDRMPYCEGVYEDAGADAEFKIYDGVGHKQPLEVQQDIVDFHRKEAALKQLSFASPPTVGDDTLGFDVLVFDDRDQFDLRVHSDERGDLTDTPATVETGESVHKTVNLTSQIEQNERISGIVVPTDTTNPDNAVTSVDRPATDPPSIRVVDQPTVDGQTITVEYAVSASYETESPIHMYMMPVSDGSKQLLGTFEPGTMSRDTFEIDSGELNTSLGNGSELQAVLVDIDTDEQIAITSVVVEGGSQGETDSVVPVAFATQPTEGREQIDIEYSVDSAYDPSEFLTLQLRLGGGNSVLLDAIAPGESSTETFSLEKIPARAGDEIEARIVDQGIVGQSRTVVVGDTHDAVDLQFTDRPTEDDPTATVQYRIDESYQTKDALTLRVYGNGLPGSVPGEPLTLLSSGDTGTEAFTVGEDVEPTSGDLTVAIVDDVPLALASTTDPLGAEDLAEQTNGTGTENENESSTGSTVPGFGVGIAIASVGGLSYMLKRRLDGEDSNDEKDNSL
jgi:archaellin